MKDHTVSQRRSLVDKSEGELSVVQQCELLGIHRSGVYYKAKAESEENLELMRKIDEQYLKRPYYGWNASHWLVGWTHGPERDDARKVHPCLVPWKELDEHYRDNDRNAVRGIPKLLGLIGEQIYRP